MISFRYKDTLYDVEVIRKNNKNTYIRVRDNKIRVTTNYFTRDKSIVKLLEDNAISIGKMIDKDSIRVNKKKEFMIFGKRYDIVYGNFSDKIAFEGNTIYAINDKVLNKWLSDYIYEEFYKHLMYWYKIFRERIPKPSLKIRKMKSRWGVCNTKTKQITLNSELINYDSCCLDYVSVHELSHFIYGNHSKDFWMIVEKYYPNYKETRKMLKE